MEFRYHLICPLFFTDVETEPSYIDQIQTSRGQMQNNQIEVMDMGMITAQLFLQKETELEDSRKGEVTYSGPQNSMRCGNYRGP